ncbi:hypothetical protein [Nocardia brevicatena]|uniref:hypothetical protein n=1 Tax=Nocardia brevicatena TaxID=37327 RepID=UPI0006880F7F|nr:hypothetical protein [Nocardia brevicatena]
MHRSAVHVSIEYVGILQSAIDPVAGDQAVATQCFGDSAAYSADLFVGQERIALAAVVEVSAMMSSVQ